MKKSVVFIIPGYKHSTSQKEYQQIGSFFSQQEISPVFVNIPWTRTVITENLDYFLNLFNQVKADKKYLLGFSFGGVIAFLASTKIHVDGQILCSLSPYFREDLSKLKKWWVYIIGKRRYRDFFELSADKIASEIGIPTRLLYGTQETKLVEERSREVFNALRCNKQLIEVPGAKHDLSDPEYLKTVQTVIKEFAGKV